MRRLYLLVLAVAGIVALASGHMLYAEFPEDISPNSEAQLWITYGHDDGGGEAPDLSLARIVAPGGGEYDLNLEEDEGGLLGTVDIEDPGCYVLDLEKEARFSDMAWYGISGYASLILEYGRALLVAESGENHDWSSEDGLEITPLVDPSSLERGDEFRAETFWSGDPVDGDYSAMVVRAPEDVLMVQHAQEVEAEGSSTDGEIGFELTKPGLWVVTFEATIEETGTWAATSDDPNGNYDEGDELEYDQIAPTAYITFWCS